MSRIDQSVAAFVVEVDEDRLEAPSRRVHKKTMGTIGEMKIATLLLEGGWSVFSEIGDNSRVDLVALKGPQTVRVQVKSTTPYRGVASLLVRKTGPGGYVYQYTRDDADVYALYVPEWNSVAFVSWREALERRTGLSFQRETRSHGGLPSRAISDWASFDRAVTDALATRVSAIVSSNLTGGTTLPDRHDPPPLCP